MLKNSYPDGKKTDTVYEYDCVGNVITVSTTGAVNIEFSYEYDRTGRMVKETRTESANVKDFFTWCGKQNFTSYGKVNFT